MWKHILYVHFVVLYQAIQKGLVKPGMKLLLVPAASGIVTGCISVTVGDFEGDIMNIDIRNIGLSQSDNSIGYIEHAKRAGQNVLKIRCGSR